MKKPVRILIVEDKVEDIHLAKHEICKLLINCEFRVTETRENFIQALETFQPDVILAEYTLPHFDGMSALKLTLHHAPLTPLLIWTGSISEDVAVECVKAGANNYVLKDNTKRLGPAMLRALEERKLLLARQELEERIEERERQLDILFSNLPGPVYRCHNDADFTMEFISAGIEQLSGYQVEELLQHGRHFGKLIHPEDRERVWKEIQAALNQDVPFELTYRIITATGVEKWVWEKGQGIRSADGQIEMLEGCITDITERRRAEHQYQSIFENSVEGIFQSSPQGRFLSVNPAMARIYGYDSPEEMVESVRSIADQIYIDPDKRSEFTRLLHSQNTVERFEQRNYRKDGSIIWTSTSARAVRDTNGSILYYEGFTQDITQRKVAEEALQISERRFRGLTRNGLDSISLLSADGILLWESPAAFRTLNYALDEHVGQDIFLALMHPDDQQWTREVFAKIVQEPGSRQHRTFRLRHANGTWHWVEAILTNMLHEPGINAIVANYRDVHEQKQTEEALQNNEKRFRALIENGLDDISLLAVDGTLLWESPSTVRNLGYAPNEFVGRNIFQLVHPDDLEWTRKSFAELFKTPGDRQRGSFRLRRSDGTWRRVEAIATNMLHDPCMNAIVINYRDITEQKQAEIELQHRNDDLALINALNEVINRGENLDAVVNRLRDEVKRVFSCEYTNIFLLNQDGRSLKNDQYSLPPKVKEKIEKLIGRAIPAIEIPVRSDSLFQRVLSSDHGLVTSDSKVIQNWIGEFIQTAGLPSMVRAAIRKLMPQIYKVLNIRSIILVPLISDGKTLGVLNVSSSNILQEQDLKRIENLSGQLTTALYRRQVEDALGESQARYQNLVETSHDLIWSVDAGGKITFMNRAARDIYGYEPEELMGHSFLALMDPDNNHPLEFEDIKQMIGEANEFNGVESRVRHRDGRQIILSANSVVLRDQEGNLTGITGTSRDVTLRKQMEEELKEERNLLRTLIDNLPDRIYAMDKQGRKTMSNTADWKASGGKTMEDVLGKTDFDTYPRELAEEFWKLDRAVLDSGLPVINYEEPGLDAEGNLVSILTSKIPLRDNEGNVTGLVGIGRDITERKQAEARMNDLLAFNEKILNHSSAGILTYKLTGECIYANEHVASMVGAQMEQLKTQNFHTLESWKRSGLYDLVQKAITTQTAVTADIHMKSTFGKEVWMTVHCVTFKLKEEGHLLLSALDITERKQAEERLRHSENRYRLVTRATNDIIWEWSPETHQLFWSENAQHVFGYSEHEIGPDEKWWDDHIHPEDRDRVLTKLNGLIEGRESIWMEEYRFLLKDGSYAYISDRAYIERDATGAPLRMIGAMANITERKQAEETLRQSQSRYRALVETQTDFIVRWQPDGTRTFANQAYCEYFGLAPEQASAKGFVQLIHEEDRPSIEEKIQRLISGATNLETEIHRVIKPDGSIGWQEWTDQAIRDHQGQLIEFQSVGRDITERKQAETERQALFEIMQGLANPKDLQEILKLVHHSIAKVIYAENFFVILHQESLGLFEEIYSVDQYDPPAPPSKLEGSITAYVFHSGQPLLLTRSSFAELAARGEVKLIGTDSASWLGVPLKTSGRTIGVMAVKDYENDNRYSEREKDFLVSIATQVALVIERKRAEEALRQSEERYRALFEDTPIAIWEEDFSEVKAYLDSLAQQGITDFREYFVTHPEAVLACADLITVLGVNKATLQMYHVNSKDELLEKVNQGLSKSELTYLQEAFVGITERKTAYKWEGTDETTTGETIKINVSATVTPGFEHDYSRVIVTIATTDVTERKRVEAAEREQRILAEALRDTAETLNSTLSYGEVLDHILMAAGRVVPHDAASILILEGSSAKVVRSHGFDKHGYHPEIKGIELSLDETTNLHEMLKTREPVIVYDTHSYPGWQRMPATDWLRSNVSAPISIYGEIIGFICLDAEALEYFTPVHAERLKAFANQAAIAIHNARLLNQAQEEIAERKRQQELLRESEERFSSAFEYASIGMALVAPDGQWLRVNWALSELLGYSEQELLQKKFQDLTHPADLESDLNHIHQLLAQEIHSYQMEKRYFHKLGHTIWTLLSVTLVQDREGKPLYFISQIQDITERRRAEEEVRHRAEETSALLQTSLALTNLDLEATLQTMGNSANRLFLADGCRIFLMEQDEETLRCVLALGENETAFSDLRLRLGEGVTGAVAVSGVPEIVNNMLDDPRAVQIPGTQEEQEAIMFAPLKERGQTIGILSIRRVGEKQPFQRADLELLEAFASMAASAVSKARLFEETQHRMVELRASEERFRQLADNIQEAFWMTDAQSGNEVYMSPAVETIWERPLQSLMYEPDAFMTSVFSEDRSAVMNAIEREKHGERVQFEYRIVRPDGSLRWIWDRAFPIYDETGNVKIIAGISADITERKQIENKLRIENERFLRFVNSNMVGIVIAEANGNIILANDYYLNILGVTRQDLLDGKVNWTDFTPLEWSAADEKAIRQLHESGVCEPYEKEYERADGSRVPVYTANAMLPGSGEQIAAFILDITERKQQEHQLRKLSRAVEHSGSAIVITDTAGNIEYVNRKFTQVTGYSFEEVIGRNPRLLKSGFTAAGDYERLWQTITSGQEWHGELLNRKKDGTLFWESVTISPILNDRNEITHFVGIKEDVTERKQNEIEIRRHIAELEAVYENGLSVGRLLEPGEIGNRVIETFSRYLPWHHVTIRLRKEGSDDLELVALSLPDLKEEAKAEVQQHYIALINKVGQGLSGWVMQTGQPLRTGNVHAHPQYVDTHEGIQSGLYMPLQVGDRVIGVISVESEAQDAFTEQDQRLLATLANQTAIAFENARLYEAMQKELSERKRVEDALRVSETHYRALADSITDILFEMDQDLHYTHWNKASEALTGIPAEDAISKSMQEIFGATEEQAKIRTIYEDVLRTHQPQTFEMTLALSGENRSFEVNAYPSMRGVSVVAKDVTDRKRTEIIMQKRFELMEYSARHSLHELMQRTVDEVSELTGSTIGFFHFMQEDQNNLGMQTWSTNALRLFQVSDEAGAHLPLHQAGVWAEAVRQRRPLIQNDYQALANKKGFPQGHVPVLREMVIPIIRNEHIMAVMGIGNKAQDYTSHDLEIAARLADYAWDVTERKQMELALEIERNQLVQRVEERTSDLSRANSNLARALRVKDEFLANMSHELRTPLNAILGLSESLGEQIAGPLNEKQQKYISTISESGHHLLSLINDILDLAKIDAGQITMDINKVDIHSVCQASLRMIKQLAQKKNQEVSLEIDHGLGLMWADERRLKQMIVNLLGNAVKFTPENGRLGLKVHGDEEANQIAITVWDNGIGIRQEDLTRLFQPFVQLDSGLAREAPGTGLGLALVAQMARLHGGSVNAVSEPGKGSRFTIVLPWEPALAIDTASRMRITAKFRAIKLDETNRPNILLVEDTKEVVMMLKDYLELAGYNVFTAQDGIDGIMQARHVKPDLILMDVQMPHMDGFETTRKLRSDPHFRYTPIIALTALAMPHDRERCLEAGMDEYISKPVNLKALIKIIQGCLFDRESHTR